MKTNYFFGPYFSGSGGEICLGETEENPPRCSTTPATYENKWSCCSRCTVMEVSIGNYFFLRIIDNEKRDTNFKNDDYSSQRPVEQARDLELEPERLSDHSTWKTTCEISTAHNTGVIEGSDSAKLLVRKDSSQSQRLRPKKS